MTRDTLREGTAASLAQILASREHRVQRRQKAQRQYGWPTLTLTTVMPGPVKNCSLSRQIANEARAAAEHLFREQSWLFHLLQSEALHTGPEALYIVQADAHILKQAMISLEETHPLGRLWDLDIHAISDKPLSRSTFGISPRQCFVCNQPAHACARSRTHSLDRLLTEMEQQLLDWHSNTKPDESCSHLVEDGRSTE